MIILWIGVALELIAVALALTSKGDLLATPWYWYCFLAGLPFLAIGGFLLGF
jgi:hypothetical protein